MRGKRRGGGGIGDGKRRGRIVKGELSWKQRWSVVWLENGTAVELVEALVANKAHHQRNSDEPITSQPFNFNASTNSETCSILKLLSLHTNIQAVEFRQNQLKSWHLGYFYVPFFR
jgi:hypothetical protein